MNTVNQINEILNKMSNTDENVIALKNLVNNLQSTTIYMLKYKGEYLRFSIRSNGEGEFWNDITVSLTDDKYHPIWTTDNLMTAIYNKYISTDWYCSNVEETKHEKEFNVDDIEVVDTLGRIYKNKLFKVKTKAIIEAKLFKTKRLLNSIRKGECDGNNYLPLYEQHIVFQQIRNLNKKSK